MMAQPTQLFPDPKSGNGNEMKKAQPVSATNRECQPPSQRLLVSPLAIPVGAYHTVGRWRLVLGWDFGVVVEMELVGVAALEDDGRHGWVGGD